VTENLAQTTVDGWTFHVMVKASELLERFDAVLVVNKHQRASSSYSTIPEYVIRQRMPGSSCKNDFILCVPQVFLAGSV
jgi:hypothetical protein